MFQVRTNSECRHSFLRRHFSNSFSPCARSRIPISRSHCPATFVSQTKSTHFVEENPNLLVVISAELRMLPNERFCSPSLKRSSFLGNKGHVRDCLYQSMQFLPALSIVLLNNNNYYQLFEKTFLLTNDWSAYTQPWVRLILLLMPFETPN